MTQLYLGLDPKNYPNAFHYPVIRTEVCASFELAYSLWPQFTHLIFTSQTAVKYWPGPWDKNIIAIGSATASALKIKGTNPLVAPSATQEGIIELIKAIKGYFFWPRSKRARSVLTDYFQKEKIPFFTLDLYDTHFQKLEPVPNLDLIDEIIFTSPSTVQGFLEIYGKIPEGKKLTAIGPVTEEALRSIH